MRQIFPLPLSAILQYSSRGRVPQYDYGVFGGSLLHRRRPQQLHKEYAHGFICDYNAHEPVAVAVKAALRGFSLLYDRWP